MFRKAHIGFAAAAAATLAAGGALAQSSVTTSGVVDRWTRIGAGGERRLVLLLRKP